MNNTPEILTLRQDIERDLNRHIRTPNDFQMLADAIRERMHEHISPTTLKRLWGYIDGGAPHWHTLSLLSRYLGYNDWQHYLSSLATRSDIESETFPGEGIRSSELQPGQLIEVTWLPDRRCIFRYEGKNTYTVTEAHNAKLQAGDRFQTACFLVGRPMFLDQLVRGEEQPTSYVAGKRNGLLAATLLTSNSAAL